MNSEQPKSDLQTQNEKILGTNKKNLFSKRNIFIGLILVVALLFVVSVILFKNNGDKSKKSNDTKALTNLPAPKKVDIKDTNTPTAYGNFLAASLESFWAGGNTNGVSIPPHKYYPSTVDIKTSSWTKQNMQLDDQLQQLISTGSIVYKSSGCDENKTSSPENKCTDYIISIDGKEIAKNRN